MQTGNKLPGAILYPSKLRKSTDPARVYVPRLQITLRNKKKSHKQALSGPEQTPWSPQDQQTPGEVKQRRIIIGVHRRVEIRALAGYKRVRSVEAGRFALQTRRLPSRNLISMYTRGERGGGGSTLFQRVMHPTRGDTDIET